ncbi:MAG TPA: hypothetical protein PLV25_04235, partial [Opitutales bacterium]|nr:hypothetical protein [Opitutales bacterium]
LRSEDGQLAAFAFPQVNHLGLLEDVDKCTDWAQEFGAISIAIIDPILLATGGLKSPTNFGKEGARILVGEAQHLALGPNFGGPGLGVFGVRFNEHNKTDIRATPGRYVGKALDMQGRPCSVMVLSTREQHIRREKATSNICSNQAFVATLVGASILARGEEGMAESCQAGRRWAQYLVRGLTACRGVDLAFPRSPCFNEFILRLPESTEATLRAARKAGLHIGIDVSERAPHAGAILKVSCTDIHSEAECRRMIAFFRSRFGQKISRGNITTLPEIPERYLRHKALNLPNYRKEELEAYYTRLGELNVSPDDACYPLGSCTMKYNPLLNDWAANLEGFTMTHPQAPIEDAQGCLQVLHEIQYLFKKITGLAAVTTQPVA